ncbi:unnamed protein product, partial [Medioppia subpectinata]
MAIYVKNPTPSEIIFHSVLQYISGVTYYLSATINPILYSIMSLKFRQAFKDTFMRCCGGEQRSANRMGKFVGSTSSYTQIRVNGTYKTTLSRATDVSHLPSDTANGYHMPNGIRHTHPEISQFIPLSHIDETQEF